MIRKPLTDESIKNIRRLQGEFRPPDLQAGLLRLSSALIVIAGIFLVWFCFVRIQRLPSSFRMLSREGTRLIMRGLYGLVALLFGPGLWRKAGRWYRFGSGQVQMLSRSGSVLWVEDVLGIVSGTISYDDRNNAFMSLRWAEARRRVDIYPSLAEALKALEPPAVPASEASIYERLSNPPAPSRSGDLGGVSLVGRKTRGILGRAGAVKRCGPNASG